MHPDPDPDQHVHVRMQSHFIWSAVPAVIGAGRGHFAYYVPDLE
jgi:hypothetical protein